MEGGADGQLARPKMREVDTAMVLRLVADNAKQRFELQYGYDPSPPRPKAKKGQGKGKGKGKAKPVAKPVGLVEGGEPQSTSPADESSAQIGRSVEASDPGGQVDAATLDDLSKDLAKAAVSTELPLISLPPPDDPSSTIPSHSDETNKSPAEGKGGEVAGEWFIRATQGHSIKLESESHLTPVLDDEEGRKRAGVCVHGTKWELWDTLRKSLLLPLWPVLSVYHLPLPYRYEGIGADRTQKQQDYRAWSERTFTSRRHYLTTLFSLDRGPR